MKADTTQTTIRDFGDQWTRYSDNEGFYASTEMLADILGPLLSVEEVRGAKVADIGSGTGRIVNMLLEAGALHVTAVEPSDAFDVLCVNVRNPERVSCLQLRGDQLPATANLDFVFIIGVLHHIPDPAPVIEAAYRALAMNGRLVLWLYGMEGNETYLRIAGLLRRITTRLPHFVLAALVRLIDVPLFIYVHLARILPLPMRDYLAMLRRYDGKTRRLTIYDQLNPAYSKYYTCTEAREVVAPWFNDTRVYHRRGYSWTVVARKKASAASA